MNSEIKTPAQARRETYGGMGLGRSKYRPDQCVEAVMDYEGSRFGIHRQCYNKPGYGPSKLYCRVHDPKAIKARAEKSSRKFDDEMKRSRVRYSGFVMLRLLRESKGLMVLDHDTQQGAASTDWCKRRDELLKDLE